MLLFKFSSAKLEDIYKKERRKHLLGAFASLDMNL